MPEPAPIDKESQKKLIRIAALSGMEDDHGAFFENIGQYFSTTPDNEQARTNRKYLNELVMANPSLAKEVMDDLRTKGITEYEKKTGGNVENAISALDVALKNVPQQENLRQRASINNIENNALGASLDGATLSSTFIGSLKLIEMDNLVKENLGDAKKAIEELNQPAKKEELQNKGYDASAVIEEIKGSLKVYDPNFKAQEVKPGQDPHHGVVVAQPTAVKTILPN